jgi:SAM-dependent methyltransferase
VACGGGDVAVGLALRARRAGVSLEVHGCDRSARALDHAREAAREAGVRVVLHEVDVLRDALPTGFDLVASTLFLHHLAAEEGVELLRGITSCGDRVLVQDLRRTALGYRLAWWGLRFLSTSSVARVDGPTSVQAAYTLDEVRDLATQAGLQGARIDPIWPQRFQLSWSRS